MLGAVAHRVPIPEADTTGSRARHAHHHNIAHEDADLAVVDFAPMPTPLAFDPDRMGAALGETARIEGDDAIGLAQLAGHLRHQHLDQRAMIPWRGADECLDDLSFDIDESGDVLGIFTGQVRQQPLEIEVHVALSGLGLQRLLIGHDERGQTVDHGVEDVGGNDAVAQQRLSPLCPRQCHLFASWIRPANVGTGREAIVFTTRYVMQRGAKAEHTVGLGRDRARLLAV